MSHWFDDAAVELADGSPFTRRTALKRAAVGALATTPLAAIATGVSPPAARAGACGDCLNAAAGDALFRARKCARVGVASLIPPLTPALGLFYWTCNIGNTAVNIRKVYDCYTGPCQSPPPPQGQACFPRFGSISSGRASSFARRAGACQTVPGSEGAPPPPGSPAVDECANCNSVGGKCCFGGPDPNHLCACANPDLPCCERYGCC